MLTRLRIALCVLLVLLQSVGLLTAQIAKGQTRRGSTPRAQGSDVKTGLQLRLSEGTPVTENQPVGSAASDARLSENDAQRVLKRLQPLKAEPSDEQDFALRDRSLPPPRTGKTITDSFPAPATLDAPDNVAT